MEVKTYLKTVIGIVVLYIHFLPIVNWEKVTIRGKNICHVQRFS